jgi:hypothetical protein
MEVVINQTIKKIDVQLTSNPKRFEVVVSSNKVDIVVEMSTLGKQGLPGKNADLSILGNYERDFAQDFLMTLNT